MFNHFFILRNSIPKLYIQADKIHFQKTDSVTKNKNVPLNDSGRQWVQSEALQRAKRSVSEAKRHRGKKI